MWHIRFYTLFPELHPGALGTSVVGRSLGTTWTCDTVNIRDYCKGVHKHPDDTPYGGGAGMVMRADIIADAFDDMSETLPLYYPSPRGALFTQEKAREMVAAPGAAFLCGRFEGVDQRVLDRYRIEEISIGDYVLSNGDIAASVIADACIRLLPGTLGNAETLKEESFSAENDDFTGLLEYPLYTRPSLWRNMPVPEILASGHHKHIDAWRLRQAEEITSSRRPDLWNAYINAGYAKDGIKKTKK